MKALSLIDVATVVVEHNVIRDGNWLVDVRGSAELRYNLLGDSHDRPWLILEDDSTAAACTTTSSSARIRASRRTVWR